MIKIMMILYNIFLLILLTLGLVLSPIILILLYLKPKYRAGIFQKIGFYSDYSLNKPVVWFHAISLGETNAIEKLVLKFKEKYPEYSIAITTGTKTGQDNAQKKFSKVADIITYAPFPIDLNTIIEVAIKAISPKMVIIAETEIYPNFVTKLKEKNIPLLLINGRFSPGSYKNYKKAEFFLKHIFKSFSLILTQTQEYKEKFINVGADPTKTEVMGNLKYDIHAELGESEISKLKAELGLNKRSKVIIAGSTHKGEDEIILDTYKSLKNNCLVDLKLLLAPRHPERLKQVEELLKSSGFNYGLRSAQHTFENSDIILVNTMGELGKLYSVSDVAFVGGSFSGTGGHNPLEPAIYKVPTISGPTVHNFKDIYKDMTATKAAFIAEDQIALLNLFKVLLTDKAKYSKTQKACIELFDKNTGSIDYCLSKIAKYL